MCVRLEEEHSLEKLFACVRRVSSGQWMRASLQGNAGLYVRAFVGWADMYIKKIRPKSWVFTCIQVHTPGAAPAGNWIERRRLESLACVLVWSYYARQVAFQN